MRKLGYGNIQYQNTLERVNDALFLFVNGLKLYIRITFLFLAILFNCNSSTRFTTLRGLNQILLLNGALLFHYYFITNKSRHFSVIIYAELYILDFLCSGEIFNACYSISPRAVRFIHSALCHYFHRVQSNELRSCAALQSTSTTTSTSVHCKL